MFALDRITLTVIRNDGLILCVPSIPSENEIGSADCYSKQ